MASAAIIRALKVLGGALANELATLIMLETVPELFSTLSDLETSMNNINSELRVMQAFIEQTELMDQNNKAEFAWIGEVQKTANRIKDTVDEFVYLVDNKKYGGIWFYWKRIFKDRKSFLNLKRISSQLKSIEKNLEHLAKIKERWVPSTNGVHIMSTPSSNECAEHLAIAAHFIDEDIVGIEENRGVLSSWLNSEAPQLRIISVWGMGGVGKTTLVTNVYKRERKHFDCTAWISISQSYTIENILRNIISEICKDEHNLPIDTTKMDLRGMKEHLRNVFKVMKYLIVLDDMWDPKAFLDIRDTLIDNNRYSRIVITSRMAEVTNLAPEYNRLELQPLLEKESWDLFCKKAFHLEKNNDCPPHLEKWATEIVSKCDGLPLALVSVGGLLSLLEKKEFEWKRVYDQLRWELDNNPRLGPLKNILTLSFKYLPSYLKDCFLYCGLFPEDFQLARKRLIRLWVAEGFIEQKGRSTLEEVAEGYLKELIHRSMLQVVKKNSSGRPKRCRMHDTLRELAISLCKNQNFGLLHEDNKSTSFNVYVRRLSIVKLREEIDRDVYLPQLVTFMSLDSTITSPMLISMILGKSRYLTVLNLECLPIKTIPDGIGDLFNLRYLGLRNTKVKCLPNSIENLTNLQTLDLMDSQIQKLPDGIVGLSKLRHLFAEVSIDPSHRSFCSIVGVSLPKGMFYLKELQTIQALESNDTIVRELGNLTQIRSLRVLNVKKKQSDDLCKSLLKMCSLSYLSIFASNEKFILQLEGPMFLSRLQKLCLFGRLNEQMLDSPLMQNSREAIEVLRLGWSQLQKDPLPSLSNLKNLTRLTLQKAYEGRKLNFQTDWFPKLKRLSLKQMHHLVHVNMELGTMIHLETIQLFELEKLVEIPTGIEHLINLKWMLCKYMPSGFGDFSSGIHKLFHFRCRVI